MLRNAPGLPNGSRRSQPLDEMFHAVIPKDPMDTGTPAVRTLSGTSRAPARKLSGSHRHQIYGTRADSRSAPIFGSHSGGLLRACDRTPVRGIYCAEARHHSRIRNKRTLLDRKIIAKLGRPDAPTRDCKVARSIATKADHPFSAENGNRKSCGLKASGCRRGHPPGSVAWARRRRPRSHGVSPDQ